jgi:NAD(P)-dependent dehydrogenase (short-subunit alcohol dehydrogenase family)
MPSTGSCGGTQIEGAVALVTGGHRGFGRAVVDELLERGAGSGERGAVKLYATSRSASGESRAVVPCRRSASRSEFVADHAADSSERKRFGRWRSWSPFT